MNIIEMNATFGKLENSNLQLSSHLNIIEGSNESGKSTWCAFIKAMFYGVDSSERDTKAALAIKNKYRPWTGSPMSGTMRVNSHLGNVTLERRTTSTGPMKEFQATTAAGILHELTEADAGSIILGIDRGTFERSSFIDSPQFPSGGGEELEKRILNLVTSGEETVSYSEAKSTLSTLQRKLKFHNRGDIPELEKKIADLKQERIDTSKKYADLSQKLREIDELENKRDSLLATRLHKAEADYAAALSAATHAEKQLLPGKPSSDELRNIEREVIQDVENNKSLSLRTELLQDTKKLLAEQMSKLASLSRPGRKMGHDVLMLVSLSLFVILLTLLFFPKMLLSVSITLLLVTGTLSVLLIRSRNTTDEYNQIQKEIAHLTEKESKLISEIDNTPVLSDETIHRIFEIFPHLKTQDSIHTYIQELVSQGIEANNNYEKAHSTLMSAKFVRDALNSSDSNDPELKQIGTRLASLRRESALIEGSLERTKSPSELDSEMTLLTDELGSLVMHYNAISIALETLEEAHKIMRDRFSPALNNAAASIFSTFTGNKYSEVVITREFNALVGQGTSDGLRRAFELSQGTADQLYIALRLAICQVVHPPSFNIPIILDDAFIAFDDSRLATALEWIYEMSKTKQILLFTCTGRERQYLSDRPGVNYTRLV